MIQKVLIAEDHESASISIRKTLEEAGIADVDYAFYCDDALEKIRAQQKLNRSYDLLITDLYFEEDHIPQKISGGISLIQAARQVQPDLRILVFSAENRAAIIESLFQKYEVDGYVRKARNDSKELSNAFAAIADNQRYFPRHIMQVIKQKKAHDFTDFDIAVITDRKSVV